MRARGLKSKKRSAASSVSKQPEPLTFFLDKCLGRSKVANAIKATGEAVELLTDHFEQDAEDRDWLPDVGRRGWVVLTKDRKIRSNQIEIVALLESGAPCFVLVSADMTGEEMGVSFVKALPDIKQFVRRFPAPFVATVSKGGTVSMLHTQADIIKKIR